MNVKRIRLEISIRVMEKTLTVAGYKCRAQYYEAPGIPIVFLHGLSANLEIWQQTKVTEFLIDKRIPFLALDMPYGPKSICQTKTRNPETNVTFVAEAVRHVFGSTTPVLVGGSIGGRIALRFAMRFPVKGLLLVSPSNALESITDPSYAGFNFPVRIVWGSHDNLVSGEEMRALSEKIPGAKLVIYEDASHRAYVDQPDRFKRDLIELYALAEKV